MAQQPKEESKLDLSNLPRGAISIKGLPVSRNTRLPSIRSPRDLTLGAPLKRTFMPNIPVRRERKPQTPESGSQTNQEPMKVEKLGNPQQSGRSKGRSRSKAHIIQTEGAIFSEGIAADPSFKKERAREVYQKSDHPSSSRGIFLKKEKADNDDGICSQMDQLLRDDFIDDGDIDSEVLLKPTIFPLPNQVKKELKEEGAEPQLATDFDPNTAKEMGFDVNRVAKFIKKEKGAETEKKQTVSAEMSPNEITSLLNIDPNSSKLLLIQFPEFLNFDQKTDDPGPLSANADLKNSDDKNTSSSSIKSLPQGFIGKLQVLKSGKTRLFIGSMEFSLESKNYLQTKHEVVSINTDSSTGDLSVLGYLQQKLKFVPNEDCLLV